MTCRAAVGVRRASLLTARYVAFPEPDLPPAHVPDFAKFDAASGMTPCKRCEQMISVHGWATKVCPGKEAP